MTTQPPVQRYRRAFDELTRPVVTVTAPEYDQRLREALAELCLALSDTPRDGLHEIIRVRITARAGQMDTYALRLHLLLHAAALGDQYGTEGRVEVVAEAARVVQQLSEDDECRSNCDDESHGYRVGLTCQECAEWPHLELDEQITELLRFVGSRVGRSGFEGLVA